MQKQKEIAAVDGHRSSEPHLDGSVVGAAGQSAIFRVPKERPDNSLFEESKALILSIHSFIYLMIEVL